MAKRNNIWANLDWWTVFLYTLLVLLGWVNIYAAVYNEEHSSIFDMTQRYGKQMLWIGAAFIVAFFLLILDSNFYVSFSYILYAVTVFLLCAVLLFGVEVNGAKSWFQIGGFAIQPAEFTKFTTALALGKLISSYNFKIGKLRSMLSIGLILFLPVVLIFLQNDMGSALVFLVFVLVLYREGLSGMVLFLAFLFAVIFIVTLVYTSSVAIVVVAIIALGAHYILSQQVAETLKALAIFVVSFSLIWLANYQLKFDRSILQLLLYSSFFSAFVFAFYTIRKRNYKNLLVIGGFLLFLTFTFSVDYVFKNVLEPYHQARINEVLGIKSDPLGVGYNVNQSKIAIGSGGFSGKGFLRGTQTKFDFVPEQSTDFIFCTVGEEWGFVGTTVVILLFLTLLIRLIRLAERQRSVFSRVYGYSVTSILFFHFAVNIGMTIGLAPVIGIPLPFFSYGGSSLWAFTILLFIFLRLDASKAEKLSY